MPREVPTYAEYRANLQKQLSASGAKLDEQQIHDSYMRTLARDTLVAAHEQLEVSRRTQRSSKSVAITLLVLFLLIIFGGISIVSR
jgi:hypothetical protein